MARININANKKEETARGGSEFVERVRGIYNLEIIEASNGLVTSSTAKNPGVPMTKFKLEIADDDERGQFGQHVTHYVTWLNAGVKGHGMAVHFLHATNMPYDGQFEFDEQDFLALEHRKIRALLELESYNGTSIDPKTGKPYINWAYRIREIYTDTNPEPAELPPPYKGKATATAATSARQAVETVGDAQEVPW